ncbi:MAG: magnesium transporter [Clostridia bacterium]|jgi:magnesium transporter|nr:magnesium transporter [Clostridia bacterium]MBR0435753.1 magnesium transporter [Clostridia bacterium]MBR3037196.1 magnesium transporter [Clostridia bacterium]
MANLATAITSLIESKKYGTLRDILTTMNAADIAALFEDLEPEMLPRLFRLLPKELAADTFVEMESDSQEMLIKGFSDSELKEVIDELYIDDAVDIVEEMPANVVKRILAQADPDTRKLINELLKYPDDSAGSMMTTEYVELRPNWTVEDAIKTIRRTGIDKETINICYVTRADRTLYGYVTIRRLILAQPDTLIGDLADQNVISCKTLDDQETVAQMLSKYDLIAIPVVDGENRLVGIVTVDDAIDVLQEEATEDIEKMAAITPSDKPYLKTGVLSLYIHRIPWLCILMVAAIFTELVINHFSNLMSVEFQSFISAMLLACIPMLMDTGGNAGNQASVTIIRGLSLGEIEFKDLPRVIFKEWRISLLAGASLAVINFAKMMLMYAITYHNNFNNQFTPYLLIAITVSIALMCTVFLAKFIGCSLPILAKKIGFDPAVMAGPFITTIVDVTSLLILFGLALMLVPKI